MIKFRIFLFLIALLALNCKREPSHLPDYIYFTMQTDIDNFQTDYPDCTEIEGHVSICCGDINNLNGLSNVKSIKGSLEIWGNDSLANLTGLQGLTSIGYLTLDGNNNMVNLEGLNNLKTIGGFIEITNNTALSSLSGLENLTSLGGSLLIRGNPSLTNLAGLKNIDPATISQLIICFNDNLSTSQAMSICGYLANPNGPVTIFQNAPGFNNPSEVANECGISLSCLPFGDYYFLSQANIDNFQHDYPNCTDLEGNVQIGLNEGNDITNLNGLYQVTSIKGDLRIFQNDSLSSHAGLEGLTHIGGSLWISSNGSLSDMAGFNNLHSIGDDLHINHNNALTSLTGLEGMTSIGGDLAIEENYSLVSLTGLDNIEAGSVINLSVKYNSKLTFCQVQGICEYLASPNGTIEIGLNGNGCDSESEIRAACESSTGAALK